MSHEERLEAMTKITEAVHHLNKIEFGAWAEEEAYAWKLLKIFKKRVEMVKRAKELADGKA